MTLRGRIRFKLESEGHCRTCGAVRGLTELTAHHLVPQVWFARHAGVLGRHDPRNVVPLCRHCHRVIDGHLPELLGGVGAVRRLEKRRALRLCLTAVEIEFVVSLRGRSWLDHHYPLATERHDPRLAW